MFGKKKQKQKSADQFEVNPELAKLIHIMPQRFYLAPKKRHGGLIIIIIVGILLVGGLLVFAFYLNQTLSQKQAEAQKADANQNQNVNQEQNVNANQNQNVNQEQNVNANQNQNVNQAANLNTNTEVNANANLNENVNVNAGQSLRNPLPQSPDTDGDGLTLAEENFYSTNPDKNDTDGDGYPDGSELLNGYDPTKPSGTLAQSGLFSTYKHILYTVDYPKSWSLREQDKEKNEVLLVAPNGEFIEILTIDNPDGYALTDWYQRQFPAADLGRVTVVKINNLSGFRLPDNQTYYLMADNSKSKIFVLIYNNGDFSTTNFITTFNVVAKSFKLLQ